MIKTKVLHYCPGFNYGGIESRLIDWYSNIDREQIQFILIKLNSIESNKIIEFRNLGGRVYSLPAFSLQNIVRIVCSIISIIREEKPDVVHVHNMETGCIVLMIAKLFRIRMRILHARNAGIDSTRHRTIRLIMHKLSPHFATDYWACSREAAMWGFGEKKLSKVKIINNGINTDCYRYNPIIRSQVRQELNLCGKKVLGTVGRFSPIKNYRFIIDVLRELLNENRNWVLLIVGDGELKQSIIDYSNGCNVLEYIIFAGEVSNVWDYYMAFDIFIGASYSEGFGTTAIEAQATGVTTFVSKGFPETVILTDFIERLDLSAGAGYWADNIQNSYPRKRSEDDAFVVERKGFDAKAVAQQLVDSYQGGRTKS